MLDLYSPNQHTSTLQTQRSPIEVTDVLSPVIQRRLNLKTSMKQKEVSTSTTTYGAESFQGAPLTLGQSENQGKIIMIRRKVICVREVFYYLKAFFWDQCDDVNIINEFSVLGRNFRI